MIKPPLDDNASTRPGGNTQHATRNAAAAGQPVFPNLDFP